MGERLKRNFVLADFDTCMCGDYRRDHVDGTGRCRMPDDASHGFKPCLSFRFARAATEIPDPYRAIDASPVRVAQKRPPRP